MSAADALAAALEKKYRTNLLTIVDLSRELRRNREALRRALKAGEMPALHACGRQVGRRVYYCVCALGNYFAGGRA